MEKMVLLVICLCLIPLAAIAVDANSYGGVGDNIKQPKKSQQAVDDQSSDDYVNPNNNDFNPVTDSYYGSDESPAFNNTYRENIHESDYGYGSF